MRNLETGELTYTLKIRGLVLDANARKDLDFGKMCELVKDRKLSFVTQRLTLKRRATSVISKMEKKQYKAVNEKGVIQQDYVFPYGYNVPSSVEQ